MTTIKTPSVEYSFTVDETGVDIHWKDDTLTIEPGDLRDGGWQHDPTCGRNHCDDGDCAECPWCAGDPTGSPAVVLDRWHADQGHPGPLRLCYEEPCKSIGDALGVRGG